MLSCILAVMMLVSMLPVSLADGTLTINSVVFSTASTEGDVSVEVAFTAPTGTAEITLLFASEIITDESSQTDKILYIDQVATPADGKFAFLVSKQDIQEATGLADIEGCTLYMMMGGTDISTATVFPVEFHDPAEAPTEAPTTAPTDAPTAAPTDAPTTSPFFRRGDLNNDGKFDAKDITMLRRAITAGNTDAAAHPEMDIDGNGKIEAKDVTILRRRITANKPISQMAPDMSQESDIIAGDKSNVQETLGGYNSIVVFDWGNLGE